jgi:REP element-mobilizing transposase RayT
MPDHVHAIIAQHTFTIEQIVNVLKGSAPRQLLAEGIHPFADLRYRDSSLPPLWARGYWKIFLNDPARIATAIAYVENNPVKEGKRKQNWKFVTRSTNEQAALRARG